MTGSFKARVRIGGGSILPGVEIVEWDMNGPASEELREQISNTSFYTQFAFDPEIGTTERPVVAVLPFTMPSASKSMM